VKRQLFVRKGVSIISMIGLLCVSLFTFCAKENPTTPVKQDPTYSFSGFIIDGNTGKALGGAMVTYFTAEGDSVVKKTGSDGGFDITGIPYGNRSFFFKYIPAGATAVQYTTAAVTIEGNDWEHFVYKGIVASAADSVSGVSGIRSVAGPVKLYPLTGSLSGTVITQLHDRAALNPIKNAVVKVTFDPTFNLDNQGDSAAAIGSNIEVGPSTFEALTDSTGKFTLTGLPVSGDGHEKVTIKVVSVTSGGIDWEMTDSNGMQVELAANQSVPVGAIILNPMVKIVLTVIDNNFKTNVVNPEHTFEITYSDDLDTVSYAVLSYNDNLSVKRNVPATVTVAGKKITINPITSLINETVYTLNVYAYGKTGQSVITPFTVTAAGGGLADVVSSNVLTATKAPVFNFGVKTPITFTFADSITGNPSVQITGGNDVLVTTSADGKTLTVASRSIWADGVINVNVVLKNGTTVRFSTALNVENPLVFVSSNVYDFKSNTAKNGLSLNSDIIFFTNKDLTTADVILKEGATTIPATVSLGEGDLKKVVIKPINTLKPATQYNITITVTNAQGESKSLSNQNFTTTAAQFYSVSDNVRIGNDPTMPRLDFAPNANIVIRMNRKVISATAVLSGGVNVKTVVSNDSIVIDPETILVEGTSYNLDVNAVDSFGQTVQGRFVTGLIPRALVIVVASNVVSADGNAVTNASKDITPWFKLSVAPVAAKIKAVITNPSVDAVVSVNGDTLVVNPVSDFAYDATPTITITGEATDGNYIYIQRSFTVMKKPVISLVASNVTTADYEGLTNVLETQELWYKLSRAPIAASVVATVNGDKAVVRVSGDTVFVKSPINFAYGSNPVVIITGQDSTGINFDLRGNNTAWPNWKPFKVREALYPVASNTWDLTDSTAENFTVYGEMWVKWSQPLSADLTKIEWAANAQSTNDLYGAVVPALGITLPNATVRVSNDTMFITPIKDRITLTYNNNVGFQLKVAGANGVTSNAVRFQVNYAKSNLFVKATNTVDTNARMLDTLTRTQTVYLVSSLPISEVTAVRNVAGGGITALGAENLEIKRTLRISGDTIFFTPFARLAYDNQYKIAFDVKLANGLTNSGDELAMTWKIRKATSLYVKATNAQVNGVMVDTFGLLQSVWVIPSAPVDSIDAVVAYDNGVAPAETSPNTDGLGTNLMKARIRISAAGDTIFWTPIDTLDRGTQYGVAFNVTLKTGEQFSGNELSVIWKTKAAKVLSVKATNTRRSDGSIIDTFGLQQEIYVVSNVSFASVAEVNSFTSGAYGAVPADMRVLANVRTSGDTIFFKPPYNLGSGTKYAVSFDVTLADGQQVTNDALFATWETKKGIKLVSTNDMLAGLTTYREFKNVGDSLVATFSQAVDTSKAFSISGFGTAGKLTYRWSSDLKTVTIKDTSVLANVKAYAITPDYSPNGTGQYNNITFTLTSAAGEAKAPLTANTDYTGLRPDLELHTEVELVAVDASYLQVHDAAAVTAADLVIDTVGTTDNLTITFNRAIDTAKVKAAHRDQYFTLVKSTVNTVPLDYTISFSNSGKTVTINPVVDLDPTATYNIMVKGVVDLSSKDTYTGLNVGNNYLTNNAFGVKDPAAVTSITTLAASAVNDTTTTANVFGKRIGTSPMAAAAGVYGNALLNTESVLRFRIVESAWNAHHSDSVDAYQWRARKVSRAGVAGDWVVVNNTIATVNYLTTMSGGTTNAANADREVTVNPSTAISTLGGNVFNLITTADKDAAGTDYTNGARLFNDSTRIELQIRALKDLNTDADYLDAGEFGAWSSSIYFVDNIAPCDSDFVTGANCATAAQGGVGFATAAVALNRTGLAAGTYTYTLTFPEDMDTSSDAGISIFYENALGIDAPIVTGTGSYTAAGVWTTARTYVISLTLTANTNYSDNAPYVAISVAGMKDASGVTIAAYGTLGTAATGVTRAAAEVTQTQGSANITGLSSM
jgi:Bacterial Ig-like domain